MMHTWNTPLWFFFFFLFILFPWILFLCENNKAKNKSSIIWSLWNSAQSKLSLKKLIIMKLYIYIIETEPHNENWEGVPERRRIWRRYWYILLSLIFALFPSFEGFVFCYYYHNLQLRSHHHYYSALWDEATRERRMQCVNQVENSNWVLSLNS